MTQAEEDKLKQEYLNHDQKKTNIKIKTAMYEIISLTNSKDDFAFYKHVSENFTDAEKTQITSMLIAKHMAELLEKDPKFLNMVKTIKVMQDMAKKE